MGNSIQMYMKALLLLLLPKMPCSHFGIGQFNSGCKSQSTARTASTSSGTLPGLGQMWNMEDFSLYLTLLASVLLSDNKL